MLPRDARDVVIGRKRWMAIAVRWDPATGAALHRAAGAAHDVAGAIGIARKGGAGPRVAVVVLPTLGSVGLLLTRCGRGALEEAFVPLVAEEGAKATDVAAVTVLITLAPIATRARRAANLLVAHGEPAVPAALSICVAQLPVKGGAVVRQTAAAVCTVSGVLSFAAVDGSAGLIVAAGLHVCALRLADVALAVVGLAHAVRVGHAHLEVELLPAYTLRVLVAAPANQISPAVHPWIGRWIIVDGQGRVALLLLVRRPAGTLGHGPAKAPVDVANGVRIANPGLALP